jgi:hypothetical protein
MAQKTESVAIVDDGRLPDLLWVHGDHLDVPANTALANHPDVPAVFIFDTTLSSSRKISLKRFGFLYESVSESFQRHAAGGTIYVGDPVEILSSIAGGKHIATTATPAGRFYEIRNAIETAGTSVTTLIPPQFVPDTRAVPNRFMKWWKAVEDDVLTLQPRLLS